MWIDFIGPRPSVCDVTRNQQGSNREERDVQFNACFTRSFFILPTICNFHKFFHKFLVFPWRPIRPRCKSILISWSTTQNRVKALFEMGSTPYGCAAAGFDCSGVHTASQS